MAARPEYAITDIGTLEALYGESSEASRLKEVDFIHPVYAQLIKAAPLAVLATSGPGGLDVSPRGEADNVVEIVDDKTLILPDRRGNNRLDSLRNILVDPRVALLFLIPGLGETLRVNGRAEISTDPDLLSRHVAQGKPPRTVLVIHVEAAYFQCSKALVRSDIWNPERRIARSDLPSTGSILQAVSQARIDGQAYDAQLPERLRTTLY